eukprot:scaffold1362_cov125-Cylindrotheca_fusiformis.AAC.9
MPAGFSVARNHHEAVIKVPLAGRSIPLEQTLGSHIGSNDEQKDQGITKTEKTILEDVEDDKDCILDLPVDGIHFQKQDSA